MEYYYVYPTEVIRGFTEDGMHVLMMYNPDKDKKVPIMIGEHEAQMILLEQEQVTARRPMTHQLIGSIMAAFALTLKEVRIERFEEGIYYATLVISDGFNTKEIDARASDAVVLALRNDVAISMNPDIIEEVGFTPQPEEFNLDIESQPEDELEALEAELHRCEENEEYERAAELMELIKAKRDNK